MSPEEYGETCVLPQATHGHVAMNNDHCGLLGLRNCLTILLNVPLKHGNQKLQMRITQIPFILLLSTNQLECVLSWSLNGKDAGQHTYWQS